jgi:hypothetical protein
LVVVVVVERHSMLSNLHVLAWFRYDVVVTTYDMAVGSTMRHALTRQWWRCVVLDEGHKIKNEETDVSEACRRIRATHRVLLTGTPMQVPVGKAGWHAGVLTFLGQAMLATFPVLPIRSCAIIGSCVCV